MNSEIATLNGSVVGVYEKDGKVISIIKYEEGYFETDFTFPEKVHLGDVVKVIGKIEKIEKQIK